MTARIPAFKSIHDAYRSRIRRYLGRLLGDAEAEDLTQQVLLKVSAKLSAFRGEAELSTWIYRIATNTALDQLRRGAGGCGKEAPPTPRQILDRRPVGGEITSQEYEELTRRIKAL